MAYSRVVDGQSLSFVATAEGFEDRETGSTWSLFGEATAGPLMGKQLMLLEGQTFLWFAWAAFRPDTLIYEGGAVSLGERGNCCTTCKIGANRVNFQ